MLEDLILLHKGKMDVLVDNGMFPMFISLIC